jgi:hypothetical protein
VVETIASLKFYIPSMIDPTLHPFEYIGIMLSDVAIMAIERRFFGEKEDLNHPFTICYLPSCGNLFRIRGFNSSSKHRECAVIFLFTYGCILVCNLGYFYLRDFCNCDV